MKKTGFLKQLYFCATLSIFHLEIMEGSAHDTLGHGRLELAAELAHLHLEVAEDVLLLLRRQEVKRPGVPALADRVSEKPCFLGSGSQFGSIFSSNFVDPDP